LKEIDFPLSLSFRSRLRQKTQEKIEEKHKKRVEKIKKEKQKKELESLNTSINNSSPVPTENDRATPNKSNFIDQKKLINKNKNTKYKMLLIKLDFGLSISGYQNQSSSNVNGKPPIYNQYNQVDRQQIYPLDDYPIDTKKTEYDYGINGEYPYPYPDESNTTLPALDNKPKFKPTPATQ
jgi:hypothetical protein